jgi:hypothetical protein
MTYMSSHGTWRFLADDKEHMYIVLVATEYPAQLGYALINEMKDECDRAGPVPAAFLSSLAEKYNNARELDLVARAKLRIEEIKVSLQADLHNHVATNQQTKVLSLLTL